LIFIDLNKNMCDLFSYDPPHFHCWFPNLPEQILRSERKPKYSFLTNFCSNFPWHQSLRKKHSALFSRLITERV